LSASELQFSVELPAAPERVFAALTEAQSLKHWLCDACESEPRVNGRLALRWNRPADAAKGSPSSPGTRLQDPPPAGAGPFVARWVEFLPPLRAAFQGGNPNYPAGDAGTVWFSLVAEGSGTRLEVRHAWPASADYAAHAEVWRSAWPRALERLARHVAADSESAA
jgi:uncharacterized protein YndB with AHSA1/START domain